MIKREKKKTGNYHVEKLSIRGISDILKRSPKKSRVQEILNKPQVKGRQSTDRKNFACYRNRNEGWRRDFNISEERKSNTGLFFKGS